MNTKPFWNGTDCHTLARHRAAMMNRQFETWGKGSRVVITFANTPTNYISRLYVNSGKTATLTHANHKTKKGAVRWAKRVLA